MSDEFSDYRGDVFYDVWMSGRDPDAIDNDRLRYAMYDGLDHYEAAEREIHRQDESRRERLQEEECQQEEHYEQERECYEEEIER